MKKQTGEALLAILAIGIAWGVFATLVVPNVKYGTQKAESCDLEYDDTSTNYRKECYIEAKANEIGKTLTDKE